MILVFALAASAAQSSTTSAEYQFQAVGIYLTSDTPVAAWQFELTEAEGRMRVVGVENGDGPTYTQAPYYDRDALAAGTADRIIVAHYSLADDKDLPVGRIRIATIHVAVTGTPQMAIQLVTAVGPDGHATDAQLNFEPISNNGADR